MEKLKILVAEHSVINRRLITETVNTTDYGIVLHSASNGQIAVEWLQQVAIDVVLLDSHLINESGINHVQFIKEKYPSIEIIIMSDKDPKSAEVTLEAMNNGALDFILRPVGKEVGSMDVNIKNELEAIFAQIKVKHYLPGGSSVMNNVLNSNTADNNALNSGNAVGIFGETNRATIASRKKSLGNIDVILIASSTGGPSALETICRQLPADFNKPVLVVQHMPPEFTHVLAETLDKKYSAKVIEGKAGDSVQNGQIIIAPGGFHMALEDSNEKGKSIKLLDTPFVNGVRPAADILFQSAAKIYKGRNVLAVILTGMGNDGTKGLRELKESCNCYCITQSESSCVVYGMPKCVFEAGLSDEVSHLDDIAFRIYQMAQNRGE